MHTKDGQSVAKGDKLWVQFEVTGTNATEEYCNCNIETVEPMFPGQNKCSLVINTKQAMKEPPLIVGFDFGQIFNYGEKALHILKAVGDAGLDVVKQGFVMYSAITRKDLPAIFAALNDGKRDVEAVIAAIKAEFDIT